MGKRTVKAVPVKSTVTEKPEESGAVLPPIAPDPQANTAKLCPHCESNRFERKHYGYFSESTGRWVEGEVTFCCWNGHKFSEDQLRIIRLDA